MDMQRQASSPALGQSEMGAEILNLSHARHRAVCELKGFVLSSKIQTANIPPQKLSGLEYRYLLFKSLCNATLLL